MSIEQQQMDDEKSFAAGFASVANPDEVAATPAIAEVSKVDESGSGLAAKPEAEQQTSADNGDAAAQVEQAAAADTTSQEQAQAQATPEAASTDAGDGAAGAGAKTVAEVAEEARIAGFTESEIKALLASAARVDTLEQGLRKAYGKIGELNGRLHKQPPANEGNDQTAGTAREQAAHQVAESMDIDPSVFGDFSEEALAKGIDAVATQKQKPLLERIAQLEARLTGGSPQQAAAEVPLEQVNEPSHQAAATSDVDAEQMSIAVEQGVLDRTRAGWREKAASNDFNSWIASDATGARRQNFVQANTADKLSGVLDQFDQWQAARSAADAQSAQRQRRLEAGITPSGSAPRPQSVPSEAQDFEAAFAQVRGR